MATVKVSPAVELPSVETVLYVDPALATSQMQHDMLWETVAEQIKAASGGSRPRAELQYEVLMAKGYYHSLPRLLAGIALDLHAPIQGRDIASPMEAHRRFSLREYKKIVALAGALEARAIIVHLTPQDIAWQNGFTEEARAEQLELALLSFAELVRYRDRHAPELLLMPEGLEYPKWWADTAEAVSLLPRLREIDPAVASCVDVAHLWHNRHLNPTSIAVDSFAEELAQHLQALDALAPVEKIHLAGAYIWHRQGGDPLHETHAVPGLAPWDRLEGGTRLFLNEPPPGFQGSWMPVGPVLDVLSRFGQMRGRLPPIAMEVHVKETEQKLQISALIRTILMRQKLAGENG